MDNTKSTEHVKLFTHNDLDGIGCAITSKLILGNLLDLKDVEYCNYSDINNKIKKFITDREWENYFLILITDISVNQETAQLIDDTLKNNMLFDVKLFDHHKTAEYLNKYPWAEVVVEDSKGLCSGNSLLFNYFNYAFVSENQLTQFQQKALGEFVEIVRKYDTWEWATTYNDEIPKTWNDLFHIYGKTEFINSVVDKIINEAKIRFSLSELDLLFREETKKENYINKKNQCIIKKQIDNYNVGIIFGEQYISELGNKICELHKDIDLVAIINPSIAISYRTIKDNVDVSEFAKKYGGGGHIKASGSQISSDKQMRIIDLLLG